MKHIAVLLALLAAPALAQDAEGRDTPGNWRVGHHVHFAPWESMCDERIEGGTLVQRCYIRNVDVFSQAPRFAALFVFVTPSPEGPVLEFGLERGMRFEPGGFRVEDASGTPLWTLPRPACLASPACRFEGQEAGRLLEAMQSGTVLAFDFTDPHGQSQALRWDLAPFPAAWEDFSAEAAARGLWGAN